MLVLLIAQFLSFSSVGNGQPTSFTKICQTLLATLPQSINPAARPHAILWNDANFLRERPYRYLPFYSDLNLYNESLSIKDFGLTIEFQSDGLLTRRQLLVPLQNLRLDLSKGKLSIGLKSNWKPRQIGTVEVAAEKSKERILYTLVSNQSGALADIYRRIRLDRIVKVDGKSSTEIAKRDVYSDRISNILEIKRGQNFELIKARRYVITNTGRSGALTEYAGRTEGIIYLLNFAVDANGEPIPVDRISD